MIEEAMAIGEGRLSQAEFDGTKTVTGKFMAPVLGSYCHFPGCRAYFGLFRPDGEPVSAAHMWTVARRCGWHVSFPPPTVLCPAHAKEV